MLQILTILEKRAMRRVTQITLNNKHIPFIQTNLNSIFRQVQSHASYLGSIL